MPVDIAAQMARLTELSPAELADLQVALTAAFDAADTDDDTDLDALDEVATQLISVREAVAAAQAAQPEPVAEPEPAAETPAATPAEPAAATPEPVVEPVVETPAVAAEVTAPPVETPAAAEVQEGLPVAASATTAIAVPQGSEPVLAAGPASTVFAGGGIPGFTAGAELQTSEEFGLALAARINTLMRLNGGDGEQVVIASIKTPAPADRSLSMGDALGNGDKIAAVIDQDALIHGEETQHTIIAAGGCCAPLVTRYDLWDNGGDTSRPVRDSLAGFRADRGGIRFFAGPVLADVVGAVGFWTCADDVAADPAQPSTWKVCARINCPPEQTAELQAITMCLTFGVLQTRIFPELAVANNKLALVAQARLADSALLAQIKAGSTAVTDAGTAWGAVRDMMNTLGRASMYFRDRYRIRSAPLRAILPSWILECLRTDLLDGPDWGRPWGQHYGVSEDEMRTFFTNRNINVTFALDSSAPATLGGGFFNAISSAALPTFPTSVQWAMFPEGAWLFLDGGQLDLGIVRDSTLVRVNDYMQFSETFEAAAHIGGESLWITSTIDVSGKYPAAV